MKKYGIGQLCYYCCNEAKWEVGKISVIYNQMHSSFQDMPILSDDEITKKALNYVKRNKDINTFFILLTNKCGKQRADELFNILFPHFQSKEELYDACHKLYDEDFSKSRILNFAVENGISEKSVEDFARLSKNYNGSLIIDRKEDRYDPYSLKRIYPDYYKAIDYVKNANSNEEAIIYLDRENELNIDILKHIITVCYPELRKKEDLEKVLSKFRAYERFKSKRRENNLLMKVTSQDIDRAKKIVSVYVFGDYENILHFLSKNGINKEEFEFACKVVKFNDLKLYRGYCKKNKNDSRKVIVNNIKETISTMKITGDKFTLRNFCQVSYLSLYEFYTSVALYVRNGTISREDYLIATKFYRKHSSVDILTYNEIMRNKVEINCARDKDGSLIPGTGYVITREDNQQVVDEMNGYRCSVYYECVFKELLRNLLGAKGQVKKKIR